MYADIEKSANWPPVPRRGAVTPRMSREEDKKRHSGTRPGTPQTANLRTPQPNTGGNRPIIRNTRARKGPGGALVHSWPRQYVIQPMLSGCDSFRANAQRRNRRKLHPAAIHCTVGQRAIATPAGTVHPVARTRTARWGIAISHQNNIRTQSATRSTSKTPVDSCDQPYLPRLETIPSATLGGKSYQFEPLEA